MHCPAPDHQHPSSFQVLSTCYWTSYFPNSRLPSDDFIIDLVVGEWGKSLVPSYHKWYYMAAMSSIFFHLQTFRYMSDTCLLLLRLAAKPCECYRSRKKGTYLNASSIEINLVGNPSFHITHQFHPYTAHYILDTANNKQPTAYCRTPTEFVTLLSSQCALCIAHRIVCPELCTLHNMHCTQETAQCRVHTIHQLYPHN